MTCGGGGGGARCFPLGFGVLEEKSRELFRFSKHLRTVEVVRFQEDFPLIQMDFSRKTKRILSNNENDRFTDEDESDGKYRL